MYPQGKKWADLGSYTTEWSPWISAFRQKFFLLNFITKWAQWYLKNERYLNSIDLLVNYTSLKRRKAGDCQLMHLNTMGRWAEHTTLHAMLCSTAHVFTGTADSHPPYIVPKKHTYFQIVLKMILLYGLVGWKYFSPGRKAAWRGLARFSISTISSSSSWVRSKEATWPLVAMAWKTLGGGGVQGFLRGLWTSMGGEVQNCTGVVNRRPQTHDSSSLLQELLAVVFPPEDLT